MFVELPMRNPVDAVAMVKFVMVWAEPNEVFAVDGSMTFVPEPFKLIDVV